MAALYLSKVHCFVLGFFFEHPDKLSRRASRTCHFAIFFSLFLLANPEEGALRAQGITIGCVHGREWYVRSGDVSSSASHRRRLFEAQVRSVGRQSGFGMSQTFPITFPMLKFGGN